MSTGNTETVISCEEVTRDDDIGSALDAVGLRLASILKRRKLSASQLAREAGVSTPSVTRLLKSQRGVSLETFVRVAHALGMTCEELLDLRAQPTEPAKTTVIPVARKVR